MVASATLMVSIREICSFTLWLQEREEIGAVGDKEVLGSRQIRAWRWRGGSRHRTPGDRLGYRCRQGNDTHHLFTGSKDTVGLRAAGKLRSDLGKVDYLMSVDVQEKMSNRQLEVSYGAPESGEWIQT